MNFKHVLLAGLMITVVGWLAGCGPKEPLKATNRPVTETVVAAPINIADASEVDLVEKMAKSRLDYRTNLEGLLQYYIRHGPYDKQVAAEKELNGLKKVTQYRYLIVADLPPPGETKPTTKLAEADVLYQDGMNYYNGGRILGVPLAYSKDKMRLALEKFDTLIAKYPQSDKVADAMFYAGEILKEYMGEDLKAIEYYKRAYEADPNLNHPAHFQRASVLDYRLLRRDEALKEYRDVLKYEAAKTYVGAKSNADFAATRIRKLSGE